MARTFASLPAAERTATAEGALRDSLGPVSYHAAVLRSRAADAIDHRLDAALAAQLGESAIEWVDWAACAARHGHASEAVVLALEATRDLLERADRAEEVLRLRDAIHSIAEAAGARPAARCTPTEDDIIRAAALSAIVELRDLRGPVFTPGSNCVPAVATLAGWIDTIEGDPRGRCGEVPMGLLLDSPHRFCGGTDSSGADASCESEAWAVEYEWNNCHPSGGTVLVERSGDGWRALRSPQEWQGS